MPNFKLKYEDSESINVDRVDTIAFNLIKSNVGRFSFWNTRYFFGISVALSSEKVIFAFERNLQ